VVKIVSLEGYQVSTYFMLMGLTYVLIALATIIRLVVEQKVKKQVFIDGIWTEVGPRKGMWVIGLVGLVLVVALYSSPIRLGTVMWFNGFVLAIIMYELAKAYRGVEIW